MAKKIKIIKQIKPRIREIKEGEEIRDETPEEHFLEHRDFESEQIPGVPAVEETEEIRPVISASGQNLEVRTEPIPAETGDKNTEREFSYTARNITSREEHPVSERRPHGPVENAVLNAPSLKQDEIRQESILRSRQLRTQAPLREQEGEEKKYDAAGTRKGRRRYPWEV